MKRDYGIGTQDDKVARFKLSKHHHELGHGQLVKLYRVASGCVTHRFFPAINKKTREVVEKERRDKIVEDPLFGEAGQRAPCT